MQISQYLTFSLSCYLNVSISRHCIIRHLCCAPVNRWLHYLNPQKGNSMTHFSLKRTAVLWEFLLIAALPAQANSQTIMLQRPGDREFVTDKAGLIEAHHRMLMNDRCDRLLIDHHIPFFIVTIESMHQYTSQSITIEDFAGALYDQWGIGSLRKNGKPWNKGILLLVSQLDRKARIELGGGYGREMDEECQAIMDDEIVPYFKEGKFSAGILAGVIALDKMARENEGEGANNWFFSPWFIAAAVVFASVLLWMILTKRGGTFFVARMGAYSVLGLWAHRRVSDSLLALLIGGASGSW